MLLNNVELNNLFVDVITFVLYDVRNQNKTIIEGVYTLIHGSSTIAQNTQ